VDKKDDSLLACMHWRHYHGNRRRPSGFVWFSSEARILARTASVGEPEVPECPSKRGAVSVPASASRKQQAKLEADRNTSALKQLLALLVRGSSRNSRSKSVFMVKRCIVVGRWLTGALNAPSHTRENQIVRYRSSARSTIRTIFPRQQGD